MRKNNKKTVLKNVRFYFFGLSLLVLFPAHAPISIPGPSVPEVLTSFDHVRVSDKNKAIESLAERLERDVVKENVGGIVAGVVDDGKIVWAKGFGKADKEKGIDFTDKSIGRTGSISKSFTAVLMMVLVDKGIIGLDEPVEKYLPEINQLTGKPDGAEKITFRKLASHTAGLIREPKLANAAKGPIEGWEQKILDSIPNTSYKSLPGSEYSYSNIGYGILGYTLSRAAKKPFMELMEEYIFKPLKMDNTTFVISEQQAQYLSKGYAVRRDGTVNAQVPAQEHSGRGYKVPNGGVYSTVHDLAKFIGIMTDSNPEKLLSNESLAEMQKIQTPGNQDRGYGLGFSIRKQPGIGVTIGHGGSVAGYNAYLLYERESKKGIVLLRNYNSRENSLGRIAESFLLEYVKN